jgi:DNA-binding response OmpR family regulator
MSIRDIYPKWESTADKSILIVVNDPATATLLEQILSGERPYYCVTAQTCHEAFDIMDRFTPDLLLLDTHLLDVEGISCYDCLQANEKFAGVPVIMLSTDTLSYEYQIKVRQLVGIDLPFDIDALLETIDLHLAQQEQEIRSAV